MQINLAAKTNGGRTTTSEEAGCRKRARHFFFCWRSRRTRYRRPQAAWGPLVLVGDRFQIEGRTFERVASKEAKCKADKCTTQGGHVFAGYGYNGVQLKQHALACLRAEVASSAKDSKRQKLQEEKTASKARKVKNELSQWTGEPAWPSWLQRRFE